MRSVSSSVVGALFSAVREGRVKLEIQNRINMIKFAFLKYVIIICDVGLNSLYFYYVENKVLCAACCMVGGRVQSDYISLELSSISK